MLIKNEEFVDFKVEEINYVWMTGYEENHEERNIKFVRRGQGQYKEYTVKYSNFVVKENE